MNLALWKGRELPLDVVTQKAAWLGRTGSGKTYGATKLAELMLEARAQVIALDPVGVWHGLRLGQRPFSIPVFGGLHGDIPIDANSGALVADAIMEKRISAVVDVSQMIDADVTRFATAFAARFFQKSKASPGAVHLFLEECQSFIPQNQMRGEEKMLHEFQRVVKLGRNFGIGVSMISQRPQEVNKKALNQAELLLAFQMTGPQERKTIEGWVKDKGADDDVAAILPKLEVGHAHVWSPQWLKIRGVVQILKKRTADISSTPLVGGKKVRTEELSPIEIDQLRATMDETIERAKEEDPKALRLRIRELEKELKRSQETKPTTKVEVPVYTAAELKLLEQLVEKQRQLSEGVTTSMGVTQKLLDVAVKRTEPRVAGVVDRPIVTREPTGMHAPVASYPVRPGKSAIRPFEQSSGALRRMLICLAQRPQGLTKKQLGVRAGISSKSGTFGTYLASARKEGWITRDQPIQITSVGLMHLGTYQRLPEGPDLREYWERELGGAMATMLEILALHPRGLSKEELGARANISHTSGTFGTYLSKMRTLELITRGYPICLSEELL